MAGAAALVQAHAGCSSRSGSVVATSITHTGTDRPSGRYNVEGTISSGRTRPSSAPKSDGSSHFFTSTSTEGHE